MTDAAGEFSEQPMIGRWTYCNLSLFKPQDHVTYTTTGHLATVQHTPANITVSCFRDKLTMQRLSASRSVVIAVEIKKVAVILDILMTPEQYLISTGSLIEGTVALMYRA